MLSLIRIRNYAIIDEVELEFDTGFSVMTGETGAGKSILVDALGLALGGRADARTVRQGANRAEISVSFDCPDTHPAAEWLREHGLDEEQDCVMRRVISAEGRSRAFINSHPVTLQDLRTLGGLLVDIHGQHTHQSLLHQDTQRQILDLHGGNQELATSVANRFKTWQTLEQELQACRHGGEDREAQLELLRFQIAELESLAPTEGELEPLNIERKRLANVDRLASGLDAALNAIYEADAGSAYALVADAAKALQGLSELDPGLVAPSGLVAEAEIQLSEAGADLARYRDRLEPDPERLEWIENRLSKIRELARKHKVEEEALASVHGGLQARIDELGERGESLALLEERVQAATDAYFTAAGELSEARAASGQKLAELVSAQLIELGLPHGRFRVESIQKTRERADANGLDAIEYQVSLNPGQSFGPLSRVASGGELSRISLALEVVGTGARSVPTMVFDEVDAGIGGGVAEIVGRRLAELAANRQVLCVTHLAQVASQGRHHYRVVKLTDGKTARTNVRELGAEDRVEELSRMLGGVEITARTRAHAEEMMSRAAD
ncbi:MAG: DNA repair protein RecN [Gammaproteobacteria bacterium]